MLRAMPRSRCRSSNRRTPQKASLRMSSVHRSPMTSRVRAIEQATWTGGSVMWGGTLAGGLQNATVPPAGEAAAMAEERTPAFAADCDECGFVYDETEHLDAAEAVVAGAAAMA